MAEIVNRYAEPTEGGYDERRFDPDTKTTTYLRGGAPHNGAGAAELWWDDDGARIARYWLYGNRVPQARVHRAIIGDVFDDGWLGGWHAMCDDVLETLADGDELAASRLAARWKSELIDDDDAFDEPAETAVRLGRRDAAERLHKAIAVAAVRDESIRAACQAVEAEAREVLAGLVSA